MNLLLMTFGPKVKNHYQAVFAILSFMRDPLVSRIIIMTDQPELYRWVASRAGQVAGHDLPEVEIVHVAQEQLTEWQGAPKFFWRVKIRAIQEVFARYPQQHLMYIDSDTFLARSLADVVKLLDEGAALMHCQEYRLGDSRQEDVVSMNRTLIGNTYAGVPVTAESYMWNAGVIALPSSRAAQLIQRTLDMCDEMCATPSARRLLEQFSFSLVLNHDQPLFPCEGTVGHYWGNKAEWNRFIEQFLAGSRIRNESLTDTLQRMQDIDWTHLPLERRPHWPAEKIKKGLDLILRPDKSRHFVPHEDSETLAD